MSCCNVVGNLMVSAFYKACFTPFLTAYYRKKTYTKSIGIILNTSAMNCKYWLLCMDIKI